MKQLLHSILLLTAAAIFSCTSDGRQETATAVRDTMRVGVTRTFDCLPLFVAQETGIDTLCGVRLQLSAYASKADCDSALLKRRLDAVFTDFSRADIISKAWTGHAKWLKAEIQNIKDGKTKKKGKAKTDLKALSAEYEEYKDSLCFMTHPNSMLTLFAHHKARISEAKQLVDKITGVDRTGADREFAAKVLDSVKVSDVSFLVQVQNMKLRTDMLLAGTLDAAVLQEPFSSLARKAGSRQLYAAEKVGQKHVGGAVARRDADKLMKIYNMACDTINKYGVHHYDSILTQRFNIHPTALKSIKKQTFGRMTSSPKKN